MIPNKHILLTALLFSAWPTNHLIASAQTMVQEPDVQAASSSQSALNAADGLSLPRSAVLPDSLLKLLTETKPLRVSEYEQEITSVALHRDSKILLGLNGNSIRVLDSASGYLGAEFTDELDASASAILAVAFGSQNKILASSNNGRISLYAYTGSTIERLKFLEHSASVRSVAFSSDGDYMLTGSKDKTAVLWDSMTGERKFTIESSHSVSVVAISNDNAHVVIGTESGSALLYDLSIFFNDIRCNPRYALYHGHGLVVSAADFSTNAKLLATGFLYLTDTDSKKNTAVKIWLVESGSLHRHLEFNEPVFSVVFRPRSSQIFVGTGNRIAKLWDIETGAPLQTLEHDLSVTQGVFNRDGALLITVSLDKKLRLWDIESREEIRLFFEQKSATPDDEIAKQNELLRAIGSIMELNRFEAILKVTEEQLARFKSFPQAVQERLAHYIRAISSSGPL